MKHVLKILCTALLLVWASNLASAQDENQYAAMSQEDLATIAKAQEVALLDLAAQLDKLKVAASPDEELAAAARKVEMTYYEAQTQQNLTISALLKKQEDIFLYQDIASYTLLVVVVVVTMAGVLFSAKELNRSIAASEAAEARAIEAAKAGKPQVAADGTPMAVPNNIKVGFDGIQITSALTGVTVLTLSLAFLYLFLQEVYEIDSVRVPHIEDGKEASGTKE